MNTMTNNPSVALALAHQAIDDRVARAQRREVARVARARRRAARRESARLSASPKERYHLPWWAFRFPHPAS
ncbi:MAG: hypothetical protein WB797_07340 [Nocardioides sp.]